MVRFADLSSCMQEILHVHVPHYCHMFESIVAGPKPWRFGHLYLPGGSASLGEDLTPIGILYERLCEGLAPRF